MPATAVNEKPILFSSSMIRAIMAGEKTETRRIVKCMSNCDHLGRKLGTWGLSIPPHRYDGNTQEVGWNWCSDGEPQVGEWVEVFQTEVDDHASARVKCPYGEVGDKLWLRETYYQVGHWESVPGVKTKTGRIKWKFVPDSEDITFEPPTEFRKGRHSADPETSVWHKRLGRFMSRKYSRTSLKITDIGVELLQDIDEDSAAAEGAAYHEVEDKAVFTNLTPHRMLFRLLWESINGDGSWAANPLVWVVRFEVESIKT